jgi:hypothetical protein
MDAPPERLYRPDKAIIAWREMCETQLREPSGGAGAASAAAGSSASADPTGATEPAAQGAA